ncbi:MAG: hypoxanthine phosphoribosyltransferase [Gammaproteobacteria bacterium]|jgi:hypoxanthine phosphoribosyltransferase|nr:hypoxanthine phosphoribosyltransferase [Gammaproteobacteria bacterium]
MDLEVLISEAEIQRRVRELAAEISRDYAQADELILVGVLKGAFIFLADLSRCLTIPRSIEFMAVSSYDNGDQESSAVRLVMDLRKNIEGKHVLVVEDIVDTGRTLNFLGELLAARKPESVKTCALVRKPDRARVETEIDYLGFEIPDAWVVGYGLDYDEQNRTLPYIASINPAS